MDLTIQFASSNTFKLVSSQLQKLSPGSGFSDLGGEDGALRGCEGKRSEFQMGCFEIVEYGEELDACYCDTDGCNSANNFSFSLTFLIIAIMTTVVLAL